MALVSHKTNGSYLIGIRLEAAHERAMNRFVAQLSSLVTMNEWMRHKTVRIFQRPRNNKTKEEFFSRNQHKPRSTSQRISHYFLHSFSRKTMKEKKNLVNRGFTLIFLSSHPTEHKHYLSLRAKMDDDVCVHRKPSVLPKN